MDTTDYTLEHYNRVKVRGPIDLQVRQARGHAIRIQAPEQLLERLEINVVDECLELQLCMGNILEFNLWHHPIRCYLNVEELFHLTTSGSSIVTMNDIDMDNLSLELQGSGEFVIKELTANQLDVCISGSGKIEVGGDVEDQRIVIKGSGEYIADQLVSDYCSVNVNGSGRVRVSVRETLKAAIFGSGVVRYEGYPDVSKKVFGSGRLVRDRIADKAGHMD